ncbi:MAG: ribosome maturation factor RimP [Lachnospiraceae bacterium]|nr:ribosome maturation factor RimP [Lachnospiraceae bacterium]
MAKKNDIENRAEELITPIINENGFKIYDVDYSKEGGNYYLRVFIDKEGGITIDDCEKVSREFNEILDREDFIEDAYIFEVSSPGLGRRLTKNRHFENSLGEEVVLKLFKAQDGQKEFVGILKSFDDKTVTVTINESEDKVFNRADISGVRLTLDF